MPEETAQPLVPPAPQESLAAALAKSPETAQSTIAAILNLIDPNSVALRVPQSVAPRDPRSKYSALIHAELCRLKVLGLSDANAARAVGISPGTLTDWQQRYPELETDMAQAAQLTTASVAQLLFRTMEGDQPHALNAIKFYLSTRTDEFREKSEVVITKTSKEELNIAVQGIFGITLSGEAPAADVVVEQPGVQAPDPPFLEESDVRTPYEPPKAFLAEYIPERVSELPDLDAEPLPPPPAVPEPAKPVILPDLDDL